MKPHLRDNYRRLRKNIENAQDLSKSVCSHIKSLEIYKKSACPALYWAFGGEVSLLDICKERQESGQKFALPACLDENGEMAFFEADINEMQADCRNIASPSRKNIILPRKLDCVFVPGLAFDLWGNRLGQGGGYYDRYLKNCENALKFGVCFSAQILQDALETDAHDVKMDFLVSENGVQKCLFGK